MLLLACLTCLPGLIFEMKYPFLQFGLQWGVENCFFWSEIGLKFNYLGGLGAAGLISTLLKLICMVLSAITSSYCLNGVLVSPDKGNSLAYPCR